jgi:DNA repair ATPase RecN
MHDGLYVVEYEGNPYYCAYEDIRPVQLICYKAREWLKKHAGKYDFRVKTDSDKQLEELSELTQYSYTKTMVSDLLFFNAKCREINHCSDDIKFFNESIFPELDLKTGEIEEIKKLEIQLKEKDALQENINMLCQSHVKEIKQLRKENFYLNKDKDTELETMSTALGKAETIIGERDEEIERLNKKLDNNRVLFADKDNKIECINGEMLRQKGTITELTKAIDEISHVTRVVKQYIL